jgi:hypothetical protein
MDNLSSPENNLQLHAHPARSYPVSITNHSWQINPVEACHWQLETRSNSSSSKPGRNMSHRVSLLGPNVNPMPPPACRQRGIPWMRPAFRSTQRCGVTSGRPRASCFCLNMRNFLKRPTRSASRLSHWMVPDQIPTCDTEAARHCLQALCAGMRRACDAPSGILIDLGACSATPHLVLHCAGPSLEALHLTTASPGAASGKLT